jgi:hypothetical protein
MIVVVATIDPNVLVVVAVVIAVVVAFVRSRDHASGGQYGQTEKNAADYGSFCVIHGMS